MPGTVLASRYVLVEALAVGENEILYSARDLQHCWQCGFEGNDPDDTFCAQCGASLDRRPAVQLLEVRDSQAEPSGGEIVTERLTMDGRTFLILGVTEPEEPAAPTPEEIRLLVGQRSDAGQVRKLDEDSLLVLTLAPTYESRTGPVLGLFAVADGMGGHEGGEIASRKALQVLATEVLRSIVLPELAKEPAPEEILLAHLRQATAAANDAVYLDRQKRENDMGTTLTAMLVRDDKVFLAHVGDCRAYRWNATGLQQLTIDHSLVASLIARGQAEPEEIYTHPHRSVIYRCIGDRPVVEVDTDVLPLNPGDRLVVCCDGLWEMVRDEGIEDVMMQEADPQAACDLLVRHANMAGGEDNISVIVVQVEAI
jgi:serine/threonine protein phosphatase PrpC